MRKIIFYNFCCRMLKWCITIIYCMKILLNSNQYNKYGKYFEKYEYLEWIMKWLLFIKQKMNEKWYLIRCIIYVLVARLKYSTWICFWRLFNYSYNTMTLELMKICIWFDTYNRYIHYFWISIYLVYSHEVKWIYENNPNHIFILIS